MFCVEGKTSNMFVWSEGFMRICFVENQYSSFTPRGDDPQHRSDTPENPLTHWGENTTGDILIGRSGLPVCGLTSRISTHGITCSCPRPRPCLGLLPLLLRPAEWSLHLPRPVSSLPSCFSSLHFLFTFFLVYYHLILTSVLSISRFFKHLTWLDFSSLFLQKLWVCAAVKVCNRADIL